MNYYNVDVFDIEDFDVLIQQITSRQINPDGEETRQIEILCEDGYATISVIKDGEVIDVASVKITE